MGFMATPVVAGGGSRRESVPVVASMKPRQESRREFRYDE